MAKALLVKRPDDVIAERCKLTGMQERSNELGADATGRQVVDGIVVAY
jgi:hypothetical protein